ncbi:MAG: ATP-binding cassette domain-containing protein [Sphingomonadales bacterium]|nr:ATP-binding cassette domain-containing protein [Sphingomonadales bacterium]MDE2167917.1 ATP-binding cassette domain-containing protein [Sphingomonadales bacterium]
MIALLREAVAGQKTTMRLGMACAVLAALSAVGLLALSGWFLVGAAIAGLAGPLAVSGFNYLLPSAAIRAAAITRTGTRYGERMLGHRAALFALAQLRMVLFGRVAAKALAGQAPGRSGAIANQLGKDVDALEDAVIRKVSRAGAWSAGVAGFLAALASGWRAGLVLIVALVLMRVAARTMAARLLPEPLDRAAAAHAALQADYTDMAGPSADIAIYGLAEEIAGALAREALAHDAARMELARAQGMITAVQTIIAITATALLAMVAQASPPIVALGLLGSMAALEGWSALAHTDMRGHDLARAQSHLASITDEAATPGPGEVMLALPPALTLCGQDIPPGSRVQLRGPSGAGKTRLIETLIGLRQDAPQSLAVAGLDPRRIGMAALRPAFALAAQDAPLMAGSVADNLLLARTGLDEDALSEALRVACVDDVVRALPDGLHQWLGGDGARLSGGQRRRIALARALLAGKPWLVLDEPSEGLDAATEARLRDSLAQWLARTGTGLLLITHRPAIADLADRAIDV